MVPPARPRGHGSRRRRPPRPRRRGVERSRRGADGAAWKFLTTPPAVCPVCGAAYDSVSRHGHGVMVSLRETERYARVCSDPVTVAEDGRAEGRMDFYHHTHEQA